MSPSGDAELLVTARNGVLDALDALHQHLDSIILIGAQAIYLHTGAAPVALAEATKDSDLALDARTLPDSPLIEDAMRSAGFELDPRAQQPGAWMNARGIPVDLMVPEALAGDSGRRGARIPPHSKNAARRAIGLEAAVLDHAPRQILSLAVGDTRCQTVNVAGPASLLVAKLHKLGERQASPSRLIDKDAHDIYRLLVAISTDELAASFRYLLADGLSGPVTKKSLVFLADLFAAGDRSSGAMMAGRAELGIGDPAVVSASVAVLAEDLLAATGR